MQRGLIHFSKRLAIELRRIPAANLVFHRSQGNVSGGQFQELADECWLFHREVIQLLNARIIVCLGHRTAAETIRLLEKDKPEAGLFEEVDYYTEQAGQRWTSRTRRRASDGITVVRLTHPSNAHWTNPRLDPTVLVPRALGWAAASPSTTTTGCLVG